MSMPRNFYKFSDITVDCENFRVRKGDGTVALTPRAFDVLTLLLSHDGHVVDKQTLFEQIWKDSFVSDNALTRIIKEIRHALDDSADNPRYIETVPKRGYRFIGKLDETDRPPLRETTAEVAAAMDGNEGASARIDGEKASKAADAQRFSLSRNGLIGISIVVLIIFGGLGIWYAYRPTSEPSTSVRSIAVLPFRPLNADSRDESLEMGMAETLITRLSNLRQLAVRPMSAVRKYTDIQTDPRDAGRATQAEAVLDGSIQKAGDSVRVTVRLIDVATGANLWSEKFDESFTDIFKVQDAIAERVTNALAVHLSGQEKEQMHRRYTNSPEAYQLYLNAQLVWHGRRPDWARRSLAYYQEALEKDPNFALAHVGVAEANIILSGRRESSVEQADMAETAARSSITRALEIDETLAQAHNALAELKYQYEYDWDGAEKEFKRAVELNPNVAWIHQGFGFFLMTEGRFDEAMVEMNRAGELDPNSMSIKTGKGRLLYYSRRFDEAVRYYHDIIAIEPNDASIHRALFVALEQEGRYSEAVEALLKYMSLVGEKPETIENLREAYRLSGWHGFAKERIKDYEKKSSNIPIRPFNLAFSYLRSGNKDEALKFLEKAFEERDPVIVQSKIEPAFDGIRDDPRFAALLRKINLQP